MSDLYWLMDEQMTRLRPCFPKNHGKPRLDGRRALNGIVFVNRNGLRWRDAPKDYGPHKKLYHRWKRWGEMGVFARMMKGLAATDAEPKTVMIDATYLKAHRTASSPRVKHMARPVGTADPLHVRGSKLPQRKLRVVCTAAVPAAVQIGHRVDCTYDVCIVDDTMGFVLSDALMSHIAGGYSAGNFHAVAISPESANRPGLGGPDLAEVDMAAGLTSNGLRQTRGGSVRFKRALSLS